MTTLRFLAISALLVATGGCGSDDDLMDEPYGYIDLAPYFFDGSTANTPTAGLPRNLVPQRGWFEGKRAEAYDFGLVSSVKLKTNSSVPDYVLAHPMYFFFDPAGNPLFSRPVYEARTGLWHIRGGRNLLDPNPDDQARRHVPYPVRARGLLMDPVRRVADYQRPIVDRLNHDGDYSGLWEIVEITAPAGYRPDDMKSYATLEKGIKAGTLRERRTQKVINCPMVDDRTYVTPSVMAYGIPRPRIEVWYRTKMGSCYLANGWETLGNADGVPYKAGPDSDGLRLDTFDIVRYSIGSGAGTVTRVVAPIGRVFIPRVRVANQDPTLAIVDVRYSHETVSDAHPRRTEADPPGYRPVKWLWDIAVPQDPPFEAGSFKDLAKIDRSRLAERSTFTRNYPLIGVAVPCSGHGDCAPLGLECNKYPALDLVMEDPPPGLTTTQLIAKREGGPRCDVPAARFGEYCAPGIARCEALPDRKDPMVANMPEVKANPRYFDDYQVDGMAKGEFVEAKVLGGYSCHPLPAGYCHFRCDASATNSSANKTKPTRDIKFKNSVAGVEREFTETISLVLDSRCGDLPGYQCVPITSVPATPRRLGVCVRQCSTGRPPSWNQEVCSMPLRMDVNEKIKDADVSKGTSCVSRNGVTGCTWDPSFEPRDPQSSFTVAP